MKDYLLELVAAKEGFNAKLNVMREYLQACVLRIMQEEGVFHSTAFLGGTALRFLYNLPRFSEDLDFSTTGETSYRFEDLLSKIKRELQSAGYTVSLTFNDKKVVHHAFIKFERLMHDAGISPLKDQKFSVKIEIDHNPPSGAGLRTDIVNKYFPISFLSYDIASLFAGKLHALMSRQYVKGRDFFDLGWYLSRWKDITPNMEFLRNALLQTKWEADMPTEKSWRPLVRQIVETTDWAKVTRDVENFLENSTDMNIFTKENIRGLLASGE